MRVGRARVCASACPMKNLRSSQLPRQNRASASAESRRLPRARGSRVPMGGASNVTRPRVPRWPARDATLGAMLFGQTEPKTPLEELASLMLPWAVVELQSAATDADPYRQRLTSPTWLSTPSLTLQNSLGIMGGGVAGALSRKGGPSIQKEAMSAGAHSRWRSSSYNCWKAVGQVHHSRPDHGGARHQGRG